MITSETDRITKSGRVPKAHYSVFIVGGGINGAGLFRDLCLQGVDCLLIESGDFCSGASAGPSRLIHGGIKYLENGEFRLVRQSTLERNLLLKNAPHYVKPIETVLPIHSWFGGIVPSIIRFFGGKAKLKNRGLFITKVGLMLFDLLGRNHRGLPRHTLALRSASLKTFPELVPSLTATATYFDARITHAERLGLELILDGMKANPDSLALNHVALSNSDAGTLELKDRNSGETYKVSARAIVNATGAWIDQANLTLGLKTSYMGGNKGSHLIVDNPRLLQALNGRMVYFGSADGRVALLYPFMGRVLVGSTDIPVATPDRAVCDDDERDYMLATLREVFPQIPVTPSQVVYTYCGVRPLPRSDSKDPGSVSRDHSIVEDLLPNTNIPIFAMIGGKWTTFRGFAEEVSDKILKRLDRKRRINTQLLPIGGGRDFPKKPADRLAFLTRLRGQALAAERCEILLDRYGTHCEAVAQWCCSRNDQLLKALPDYSREEIVFIFRHELVGRLADVIFRRTDIALSGRLTAESLLEIAEIGRTQLGWNQTQTNAELSDVLNVAREQHGMKSLSPVLPVQ